MNIPVGTPMNIPMPREGCSSLNLGGKVGKLRNCNNQEDRVTMQRCPLPGRRGCTATSRGSGASSSRCIQGTCYAKGGFVIVAFCGDAAVALATASGASDSTSEPAGWKVTVRRGGEPSTK